MLDHWGDQKLKSFLAFNNQSPDGMHGFVPSAQCLRDLYNDFIESHCEDFNQHMGMLTAEVAAIDHSHKVCISFVYFDGNITIFYFKFDSSSATCQFAS